MNDELKKTLIEVLIYLLPPLGVILTILLKNIAGRLAKILGVVLDAEQQRAVDAALETGVRAAEERGRKLLKENFPISGEEKSQIALETARRVEPQAMAKYGDLAARDLLDAKVHQLRPSLVPPVKDRAAWQENAARATGG